MGSGRLPIHAAAIYGHAAVVEYLGAAAPDTIKTPTEDGWLPIHLAASGGHAAAIYGHAAVVEYLAAAAPDTIKTPDKDGRLPIDHAASLGHAAVVEYLAAAALDTKDAKQEK